VIVNFIASVIRIKIIAIFLGPVGLGIVSQFTTFITLITSTIHIGTPFSLSSVLPGYYANANNESRDKIASYYKTFTLIFLIITILISSIIFIFSDYISLLLIDTAEYSFLLKVISISFPFSVVYSIFESFLRSSGEIGKMVKSSVTANLIAIPSLYFLIKYLNIDGFSYYILIGAIIPIAFLFVYFKSIFQNVSLNKISFLQKREINNVLKAGVTSLIAFLLNQLVILYLRKFIIINFNEEQNGLYQSVLGMSLNLFSFIYSFLSNYTLPQYSMFKNDKTDNPKLISTINETMGFILFLTVPMILGIFSLRIFVIEILYSKLFVSAENLLLFQLLGDLSRVFSSLFSLWMFSRMKIKELIIIDVIFNLLLFLLPNLFINMFPGNLIIIPVSYFSASLIQFILFYIYTGRSLKFSFTSKSQKSILLSALILSSGILISISNAVIGYAANTVLLLIWVFTYLKYIEKKKLKEVFSKIKKG